MRERRIVRFLSIAALVGAATVGPALAQVSPYPNVNTGSGALIQQGVTGSRPMDSGRYEQRQLDQSRYSVQQQSCASMSGASADRCFSELRTTIEADKLRNQANDAAQPRQK